MQTTTPRPGSARAEPLEVVPRLRPEDGEVDHDRVEAHRDDGVGRHRAGEHAVLPAEALQALAEHLEEAGVGVQHGDAHVRAAESGGRALELPAGGDRFLHRGASLIVGPAGRAGVENRRYTGFSHALSGEFAARRRPRRAISGAPPRAPVGICQMRRRPPQVLTPRPITRPCSPPPSTACSPPRPPSMARLTYARKFVLIGIVLLAPAAIALHAYWSQQGGQIAFSAKERVGVVELRPANDARRPARHRAQPGGPRRDGRPRRRGRAARRRRAGPDERRRGRAPSTAGSVTTSRRRPSAQGRAARRARRRGEAEERSGRVRRVEPGDRRRDRPRDADRERVEPDPRPGPRLLLPDGRGHHEAARDRRHRRPDRRPPAHRRPPTARSPSASRSPAPRGPWRSTAGAMKGGFDTSFDARPPTPSLRSLGAPLATTLGTTGALAAQRRPDRHGRRRPRRRPPRRPGAAGRRRASRRPRRRSSTRCSPPASRGCRRRGRDRRPRRRRAAGRDLALRRLLPRGPRRASPRSRAGCARSPSTTRPICAPASRPSPRGDLTLEIEPPRPRDRAHRPRRARRGRPRRQRDPRQHRRVGRRLQRDARAARGGDRRGRRRPPSASPAPRSRWRDLRGGRPRGRRDRRAPSSDVAQGAERQVRMVESTRAAADEAAAGRRQQSSPTPHARPPRPPSEARAVAREGVAAAEQATEAIRAVADSSGRSPTRSSDLSARSERDRRHRRHDHRHRRADEPAGAQRRHRGRPRRRAGPRLRRRRRGGPQARRGVPARRRRDRRADRRDPDRDDADVVDVVEDGAERTEDGVATVEQTPRGVRSAIGGAVEDMTARVERDRRRRSARSPSAPDVQSATSPRSPRVAEQSSASAEQVSASTRADERLDAGDRRLGPDARRTAGSSPTSSALHAGARLGHAI